MTARIEVRNLSKSYGTFRAVSDLSLGVEAGSVCGLLGPNGAGKTTTFKCLLGFARPSSGEVRFDGKPLAPEVFERLGHVPERSALYDWMSVADHVELTRRSFRRFDAARAAELLALFSLPSRKPAGKLSKGQRTALAIALAFSVRPELLILDEPASGLDPIHQRSVLDLIIEAAAGGAAILFSSHQITQVERAADRIVVMKNGKSVLEGDVDVLKTEEKIVEAIFDGTVPDVSALARDERVRRLERTGRVVRVFVHADGKHVLRELSALNPRSVQVLDQNLEDIFLNAVAEPQSTGSTDVLH